MEPEKVPSVVDALDTYEWHDDAACADSDDPDMWFVEPSAPDRTGISNPRMLEAFLTCAGCPVRRDCLSDALTTWRVVLPYLEHEGAVGVRAVGVWGATTEEDRAPVRGLPIGGAIDRLELELPDRLRTRIEAFKARYQRDGRRNQRADRVWAMLERLRGR